MLGAASPLKAAGFTVDADESRQFGDYLEQLQAIVASGKLPEVVVVHLGTNGNIDESDAHEFFELLADVPRVIVLTNWVDRPWTESNNELILSLPDEFPNVDVGYWARHGTEVRGQLLRRRRRLPPQRRRRRLLLGADQRLGRHLSRAAAFTT